MSNKIKSQSLRLAWLEFILTSVIALLLSSRCLYAQPVTDMPFDVSSEPAFENYQSVMIDFLKKQRVRRINDICILGYTHADQSKSAWVVWKQGKKIVLWEGGDEPLASSRRVIDLTRDVVRGEADVHGSTYLVTSAWVHQIINTCNQAGTKIRIAGKDVSSSVGKNGLPAK